MAIFSVTHGESHCEYVDDDCQGAFRQFLADFERWGFGRVPTINNVQIEKVLTI